MFEAKSLNRLSAWFYFLLWLLVIFLGIFYARSLQSWVVLNLDRQYFTYFAILFLGAVSFFIYKKRHSLLSKLSLLDYFIIVLVLFLYLFRIISLSKGSPEEAMHFIEYGVLYLLTLRLLLSYSKNISVLISVLLITSLFGTLDEIIQWLVPGRFFDWRDVGLNFFSALMVFLLIFFPFRPKDLEFKFEKNSFLFSILSAMLFINTCFLCLINTPESTILIKNRLQKLFPETSFASSISEMTEYGYLYKSGALSFKSRLSSSELEMKDRALGKSLAFELKEPRKALNAQAKYFSPFQFPYEHELLIRANRMKNAEAKKNMEVFNNEGFILKKYFPNFFVNYFSKEEIEEISTDSTSSKYFSPVSLNLITIFTKSDIFKYHLVLTILLLVVFIKICFQKIK